MPGGVRVRSVPILLFTWLSSLWAFGLIFRDLASSAFTWLSSAWSASGSLWLLGLSAQLWLTRRGLQNLPRLTPDAPLPIGPVPRVSVIVAARDEAATIERAMRSLLGSDYPDLEVLAVDDRSTDGTGPLLERLAAEDRRLRVLRVDRLPSGWLGKNHALCLGAEQATGQWLLFTDADIRFAPHTVRSALAFALEHQLDHVTAAPAFLTRGLWLRVFLAQFSLTLSIWQRPWNAARADSRASVGFGAFNLVAASAYHTIGGHRTFPLAVADDVVLGRKIKWAGFRQMLVIAGDAGGQPMLQLEWYPDVRAAIRGFEKNAFAMFNFQTLPVLFWSLVATAIVFAPLAALLLAPGWHRIPWFFATVVAGAALGFAGQQFLGYFPWPMALLYPLAQCLLTWTLLRSAWITLNNGGVRWRDTFYPLRDLRNEQVSNPRQR